MLRLKTVLLDLIEDLITNKVHNASNVRKLVKDVLEVLREEFKSHNGLIRLSEPQEKFLVVGDLHGDLQSLTHILRFAEASNIHNMIFLGDYVDRGENQVETILIPLYLKLKYPDNTFLLRGNHEPPEFLPVYPHDFPVELRLRYGSIDGIKLYSDFKELFQLMPHALIVEGTALLLHGGPPTRNISKHITAYEYLLGRNDDERFKILEEVLWNDPTEDTPYAEPSYRGAGYLFGYEVTKSALSITNTRVIVRGHEPCFNGFKLNHDGRVVTLFSRLGPPYNNAYASFMILKPRLRSGKLIPEEAVVRFSLQDL
ncbi:MAG: metallophosphoesterase family protein [Sulfolobales archaeon]